MPQFHLSKVSAKVCEIMDTARDWGKGVGRIVKTGAPNLKLGNQTPTFSDSEPELSGIFGPVLQDSLPPTNGVGKGDHGPATDFAFGTSKIEVFPPP